MGRPGRVVRGGSRVHAAAFSPKSTALLQVDSRSAQLFDSETGKSTPVMRANERLDPVADHRIAAREQIRIHDKFVTGYRRSLIRS